MKDQKENLFQTYQNLPRRTRAIFWHLERCACPERHVTRWRMRRMPEEKIREILPGQWPSLEELAFWTRFTIRTIKRHLKTLEELGMINTATREIYLTTGLTWDQNAVYSALVTLANGREYACPETIQELRIAMGMGMDMNARDIQNSLKELERKGAIMITTEKVSGKSGRLRKRTAYRFLFHPAYEKVQASFPSSPRIKMPILYQPDKAA